MGEEAFRIHQVGAPGLDDILQFRRCAGGAGTRRKSASCMVASGYATDRGGRRRAGRGARGGAAELKPAALCGPMVAPGELKRLLGAVAERPYALVIQHPSGQRRNREAATMEHILAAVEANKLAGVVVYPSSDPGHDGIIRTIRRWEDRVGWRVFRSLPRAEYLSVASGAAVMVGNSSSGMIESASLGVSAVNVGLRSRAGCAAGPR